MKPILRRKYYLANKPKEIKAALSWRDKNPKRYKYNIKKWTKNNPDKLLQYSIKKRLGKACFSLDEYKALVKKQKGLCAICGTKPKIRLHIDHCHKKLKVRGLLCFKCNIGLGMFNDNPNTMKLAIKYIKIYD